MLRMKTTVKITTWLRVILMMVSYVVVAFAAAWLTDIMIAHFSDYLIGGLKGLVADVFSFTGILLLIVFFLHYVDKIPFKALGLRWKGHVAEMWLGFAIGTCLIAAGVACLLLLRQIELVKADFHLSLYFIILPFTILLGAFKEEIVLRGYVQRNLMQSCNKYVALLVSSLLFSLLHIFSIIDGGFTMFPLLQIFLLGVLLGLPYLYTQNLWCSVALHFSLNFFQGFVFGFSVSGTPFYSLLQQQRVEDNLLNGGNFGFEGSILCALLTAVACVWIGWRFKRKNNI
jgi:membrane protease YdiL (CAAX protease family)